jgi:transcriptional regulator with XRE-family HTH domain
MLGQDQMVDGFFKHSEQAKPGAALKALRLQRGWTLTDVSGKTRMPVSTLSKIENGKIALTLEKLLSIGKALEVDVSRLFEPNGGASTRGEIKTRRSVSKAGEGKLIDFPIGSYLYVNSDLLHKKMIPIIGDVRAKSMDEFGEFLRHSGEEYVYVLEGILEFVTEHYAPVHLTRGDSLYFDSDMGHAYLTIGDEPCRILSVCATSESQTVPAFSGNGEPAEDGDIPVRFRVSRATLKGRNKRA